MRNSLALMVAAALLLTATAFCQGYRGADAAAVVRILDDRALWGEDFYGLLASLATFQQAGEPRIQVFADRVVGTKRYDGLAEAQRRARALEQALRSPKDQSYAAGVRRRYATQRPLALNPTAIQFVDDGSYRVAVLAPDARFLPAGLKTATVLERLGKPEKVTTELLDDGKERRPVILTVYHYAGGAIAFAESDIAPRPGFVNRVFLDVPAITSSLEAAP